MKKLHFVCTDPQVNFDQISKIKNVEIKKIDECIKSSKIVIISTPWKQFLNYLKGNRKILKNKILIDPFNLSGSINGLKYNKRFTLGDKNNKVIS